jgi:hypothetical protein
MLISLSEPAVRLGTSIHGNANLDEQSASEQALLHIIDVCLEPGIDKIGPGVSRDRILWVSVSNFCADAKLMKS